MVSIALVIFLIFRAEITWSETKNYALNFSEGQYNKAHVLFLQAAKADPNSWVRYQIFLPSKAVQILCLYTLESGINVGARLLIVGLFPSGYLLIIVGTFINFFVGLNIMVKSSIEIFVLKFLHAGIIFL